MQDKPNCYECIYRRDIPGDAHSSCHNPNLGLINVKGHLHGIKNGWFFWPINFDPVWLTSCDGFKKKNEMATCDHTDKQEPHICPFAEDVHGDSESLCTCCDYCTNECADDI